MSEKDLPILPLFVKDWLGATVHWTDAERGAYMSLLVFQWVNNKVPSDTAQLARIMGTPEREFELRWGTVGPKFDGDQAGLFNNRLEEHRKKALRLRDRHALGATVANANRRAKRIAQPYAEGDTEHDAKRSAEHHAPVTPTSTSTSTSTEEEKNKKASLRSAHAERAPRGTPWNDEWWIDFKLEYPHRIGGVQWARAMKAWKARLREGHTWDQLIEGVKRYAAYCVAVKKDPEYVMHASTFCGPDKGFMQEWEIPVEVATAETWQPPTEEIEEP